MLHNIVISVNNVETARFEELTRPAAEELVIELAKTMYNAGTITNELKIQIIASS